MTTQFDVVIIGSGAGGAPIAYTLANAGKSVLVLEKGPLFRPQYQDPLGVNAGPNLRDDPNGGGQREARDWPISYDTLEPYYCQAERLVGINGTRENQAKPFSAENYQRPFQPNPISRMVETGMDALGMPRY